MANKYDDKIEECDASQMALHFNVMSDKFPPVSSRISDGGIMMRKKHDD